METNTKERLQNPEYESLPATIRLEFFRHDDKAKATAGGDRNGDEFIRLTEQGRQHATNIGKTKNPNAQVAVAFGSTRERAIETSLRQMLANEDSITPEMSLEDMRAEIDKQLKVGQKDKMIRQLNFDWDSNEEFHDIGYKHYLETKDALIFLQGQSDDLVKKNHDLLSDSYSRSAGNFAELITKYLRILPRWKQILEKQPEKYASANNQLQRFFGTHQTVAEPFLMKVIEKTKGSKAVEEFINSLKSKNGFDLSEGYSVEIKDTLDQPEIVVSFRDQQYTITPELLKDLIKERDNLDQSIKDALKKQ